MSSIKASSSVPSEYVQLELYMRYCADAEKMNDTSKASSFFVRECRDNIPVSWRSHFYQEIDAVTEEARMNQKGKVFLSSHEMDGLTLHAKALSLIEASSPNNGNPCWLKLDRLPDSKEEYQVLANDDVRKHLEEYLATTPSASLEDAVRAIDGELANNELVKDYLFKQTDREKYQRKYNQFYEWTGSAGRRNGDLMWGFGHVRKVLDGKELVNGPWMEMPLDISADNDGNISVKPREGARLSLNREVSGVLQKHFKRSLKYLEEEVEKLGRHSLSVSPSNPNTYKTYLRNMVTKLSSDGNFQENTKGAGKMEFYTTNLLVTDAWCIYSSTKANSSSARDADQLANELSIGKPYIPRAALALTHGPSKLDGVTVDMDLKESDRAVPYLPLAASVDQLRLIELLIQQKVPGAVLQGPPGTGKTHTIANVTSAYLCCGKRVLIHSKSSQALSVISQRMPTCLQNLCVDLSASESALDTRLPLRVEGLYNQIDGEHSMQGGAKKAELISKKLLRLEANKQSIDRQILHSSEARRRLFALYQTNPFMKKMVNQRLAMIEIIQAELEKLVQLQPKSLKKVETGCDCPVSDELIAVVEARSKKSFPISRAFKWFVAFLGSHFRPLPPQSLQHQLSAIKVDGKAPESEDWQEVGEFLRFKRATEKFNRWLSSHEKSWPKLREPVQKCKEEVDEVMRLKKGLESQEQYCGLDASRNQIVQKMQDLAGELTATKAVVELAKDSNCTPDDLAAMLNFSQIASSSKFSPNTKISDRQSRHVEEARNALKGCGKIPCWIMTTNQISEFLPADFCSFDLVILDEASQSDTRALPAMVRGKQWLIVGDSKQVSPTEDFKSEKHIQQLVSMLPRGPFRHSMGPGKSFFDLSEQMFAKGCRVSLKEHFRCSPELIVFSNNLCYDNRLIPLRLPTSSERIRPSLVDLRVQSVPKEASKVGRRKKGEDRNDSIAGKQPVQIHEPGCAKIVDRVRQIVATTGTTGRPRTIGIVMYLGKEQIPEITKRLTDETTGIGPSNMKRHDVLIADAATIQGIEKDIILVGILPIGKPSAQNQLRDIQRANVALSRSRDQMLLIRSIDASDVAPTDIKSKIIEFFAPGMQNCNLPWEAGRVNLLPDLFKSVASELWKDLEMHGFKVTDIGAVWNQACCVELPEGDARAAICVEIAGESEDEWYEMLAQQRSLERVGWHCFRVDALSLLTDHLKALLHVMKFLEGAGLPLLDPCKFVTKQQTDEGTEDISMKDDPSRIEVVDATSAQVRRTVWGSTSSNNSGPLSAASGMHDDKVATLQKKRKGSSLHAENPQKTRRTGHGGKKWSADQ